MRCPRLEEHRGGLRLLYPESWVLISRRECEIQDAFARDVLIAAARRNEFPMTRRFHGRARQRLDEGWPAFPPSNLEITSIDVGNDASNVIPAEARARLNIRFNPTHTGAELEAWLATEAEAMAAESGCRVWSDGPGKSICSSTTACTLPATCALSSIRHGQCCGREG